MRGKFNLPVPPLRPCAGFQYCLLVQSCGKNTLSLSASTACDQTGILAQNHPCHSGPRTYLSANSFTNSRTHFHSQRTTFLLSAAELKRPKNSLFRRKAFREIPTQSLRRFKKHNFQHLCTSIYLDRRTIALTRPRAFHIRIRMHDERPDPAAAPRSMTKDLTPRFQTFDTTFTNYISLLLALP